MLHLARSLLLCEAVLLITACDQIPSRTPAAPPDPSRPIVQDVKGLEKDVELTASKKRIEELEVRVATLESNPEKLDLELMTTRLTALEAKVYGAGADPAMNTVQSVPARPIANAPLPPVQGAAAADRSKRTPNFTLPELERRNRPATPDEIKAFQRGGR